MAESRHISGNCASGNVTNHDRTVPSSNDTFNDGPLFLPDPYVTERPRWPHNGTIDNVEDIIDLTDSPPALATRPEPHEVIDIDSLPDTLPRPHVPIRRPSPSSATERERLRVEALRALAVERGLHDLGEEDRSRTRRREWLFATAQSRTQQRERQEREQAERQRADNPRPESSGRIFHPEVADMRIPYRAYVRGPNGGGPINSNQIPHHFLAGARIAFVPQLARLQDFTAANLGYLFPDISGMTGARAPESPATTKYVAPEPCKEPFTRTYTETDVLICPGCRSELGGVGDEAKRKIFISKCSHVYCGECGNEIKSAAKKQGIVCKAPGCAKKITKARIFEAYV